MEKEILKIISEMIKENTKQAVNKPYPSKYDHKTEVLIELRKRVSRLLKPKL